MSLAQIPCFCLYCDNYDPKTTKCAVANQEEQLRFIDHQNCSFAQIDGVGFSQWNFSYVQLCGQSFRKDSSRLREVISLIKSRKR